MAGASMLHEKPVTVRVDEQKSRGRAEKPRKMLKTFVNRPRR